VILARDAQLATRFFDCPRRAWTACAVASRRVLTLLILLAALGLPRAARAQGGGLAGPHWGATMYPDGNPIAHVGVQLYQFTEFDKKRDPVTGEYLRYNDYADTVGLNLLSLSHTRSLNRTQSFAGNLLFRSSLAVGLSHDASTAWFQNKVIHKVARLDEVPRGATRNWMPLVNYGGELDHFFHAITRGEDGRILFSPTPIFAGAGFSAGSIAQDLFVRAGVHEFALRHPALRWLQRFIYPSFSAVMRLGMGLPGLALGETSLLYAAAQTSVRLHIAEAYFPIVAEAALMGSTGFFRSGVGPAHGSYVAPPEDIAPADRSGRREHFIAFRLQLGDFVFETFNDVFGGKDRGPTYGFAVHFIVVPGSSLEKAVSWL
jgi:hypothetical protein